MRADPPVSLVLAENVHVFLEEACDGCLDAEEYHTFLAAYFQEDYDGSGAYDDDLDFQDAEAVREVEKERDAFKSRWKEEETVKNRGANKKK